MKIINKLLLILILTMLISCTLNMQVIDSLLSNDDVITEEIQEERDEIYMLLAYAVVLNDWQDDVSWESEAGKKSRGYNIGSVLVAPDGQIVNWARNCNIALKNGTQHGEIRLMTGYLNRARIMSLWGYTIYTTLEPCIQCAGMMIMSNIERTVYGQTDPFFGNCIERLTIDSKKWNKNGYEPYPRTIISERSNLKQCEQLDRAYKNEKGRITSFLSSKSAKEIFISARKELINYKIKYPKENEMILQYAMKTLSLVTPGIPEINIK